MATAAFALCSVFLVSLVSLVGLLTISMAEARVRALASPLVAFAAGALLGDAFIHLIPEAFAGGRPPLRPSLTILAGMLAFFVVEKVVRHRHGSAHVHGYLHGAPHPEIVSINILGDAVHNFIDGVLIGGSWLASPALGLSTTVAVFLHELPQEIGDFGILVHAGLSPRRAVLYNLASAGTAIAGTVLAIGLGSFVGRAVSDTLVPLTAGGFVYLAAADLFPELQHEGGVRMLPRQVGLIALGVALLAALSSFE